jgi:NAD(P)-dependent dehydrogenase (short-subunit alcohol dehydrogenase family)
MTRTVLITGCSSGFGEVTARTLAAAGHHVFATMRDVAGRNAQSAGGLRAWAAEHGGRLDVVEMDVAEDASVNTAVEAITGGGVEIDVVVNNAGIAAMGPIEAFDIGQMQALYNVNVFGPLRVDKAVLPSMRARRSGLLIHVSSTLGRVLPGRGGLYPASKWAVEGLAESLAYEIKPFGVDLAILEPGAFPTTATARGLRAANADIAAEYAAVAPPRLGSQPMSDDYALPDLQDVADAIERLIELPQGERPLRTVVGPIFTEGIPEYNEEYERVRAHLREVLRRPDKAVTWVRGTPAKESS